MGRYEVTVIVGSYKIQQQRSPIKSFKYVFHLHLPHLEMFPDNIYSAILLYLLVDQL